MIETIGTIVEIIGTILAFGMAIFVMAYCFSWVLE